MKQYIILISTVLFLSTFWINTPSVQAEMISTEVLEEDQQACQQMSSSQKKNWETVEHFLKPDDVDVEEMKKHLNQNVLSSQKQLQAELELEKFVKCPDIEEDSYGLSAKMAAYNELLVYIDQIMEKEDSLEIKDLTFKRHRNGIIMEYINVTFEDGKTVEVKLFNSALDRSSYELEEKVNLAEKIPDWIQFLYTQVIIPISKIIDTPLQKSVDLYVNKQEAHKEKNREDQLIKTEDTAYNLDANISLTEETHKKWEEPFSNQKIYITSRTYSMLERWEEMDEYTFPKESIQKRDWEKIAEAVESLDFDTRSDI